MNYEQKFCRQNSHCPVVSGEPSYMPLGISFQKAERQNQPNRSGVCCICIPNILCFRLILIKHRFLKTISYSEDGKTAVDRVKDDLYSVWLCSIYICLSLCVAINLHIFYNDYYLTACVVRRTLGHILASPLGKNMTILLQQSYKALPTAKGPSGNERHRPLG